MGSCCAEVSLKLSWGSDFVFALVDISLFVSGAGVEVFLVVLAPLL